MLNFTDLEAFTNTPPLAATAATHLLRVPRSGVIVDEIILKFTASGGSPDFTADDLSQVELTYDGKPIWNLKGSELKMLNAYNSRVANASYLSLEFIDETARVMDAQRWGALDLVNRPADKSLTLKVVTDGTQAGTTLALEAFYRLGEPKQAGFEPMVRSVLSADQAVGAIDETLDVPLGVAGAGNWLRAIHVKHSNMTHAEVRQDNLTIMQKRAIADYAYLWKKVNHTPQSGWFCYDFIHDQILGQSFDPLRADRSQANNLFKATFSGAESIRIVSDLLAQSARSI